MSFWASVTHTAASLQKPPNQNFRCIWKSVCPLWRTYKVLHSLRCLYPNLNNNNNNNKITCLHLCFVGLLCVETEAFPWTCSSSSSCPLLGRSFTDGCNEQRLHSDSRIVHLDTRGKACLGTTALMIDYYNEMKKNKKQNHKHLHFSHFHITWDQTNHKAEQSGESLLVYLLFGKSRVNDKHHAINC